MNVRLLVAAALAVLLLIPSAALADGWSPGAPVSASGASAPSLAADDAGLTAVWVRDGRVEAAPRGAFGTFPSPQALSGTGAGAPTIAASASGRAVVAWVREGIVEAAIRPGAGEPFGAAQAISGAGAAEQPRVGIAGDGAVTVAWARGGLVEIARRTAAQASWPAPQAFAESAPGGVALAVAPNGAATAVWSATASPDKVVRWTGRAAGQATFQGPATIEAAEDAAGGNVAPDVAVDAAGNATAVWPNHLIAHYRAPVVRAASRPAGGSFGPASSISGSTVNDKAMPPNADLAVNAGGDTLAVWNRDIADIRRFEAARRLAGAAFEQRVEVAQEGVVTADAPAVAIDAQGRGAAVWAQENGVHAARMTSGFAAGSPLSAAGGSRPDVVFDTAGNAVAAWQRGGRIETAAYDVVGPQLAGLEVRGETFAAQAADGQSAVWISWDFGDGTSAEGAQVTHRYSRTGSYEVRVTATDGGGNAVSATRTIEAQRTTTPAGDEQRDPEIVVADDFTRCVRCPQRPEASTTPALSGLRVRGRRVTFRLNTPARVVFTVERAKGRRFRRVRGSLTVAGRAGVNAARLKGRLARLGAGRYRLVAKVAGGRTVRKAFRVTR